MHMLGSFADFEEKNVRGLRPQLDRVHQWEAQASLIAIAICHITLQYWKSEGLLPSASNAMMTAPAGGAHIVLGIGRGCIWHP